MDVKVIVATIKPNVLEVCRLRGEMYDASSLSASDHCETNSSHKELYRLCELPTFPLRGQRQARQALDKAQ